MSASALDVQVGGNHYRQGGIQPVQYIEANDLKYLEGAVVKRVTRHDKEGGKGRQDIEKAIHELELLLELRYPVPMEEKLARDALPDLIPSDLGRLQPGECFFCGPGVRHGGLPCPKYAPAAINTEPYVYSQ